MNETDGLKRNKHIERLVSNARAILTNQIGFALGVHKMVKILGWIELIQPLDKLNMDIFYSCDESISRFDLSVEKLKYNIDFLIQQDAEIEAILSSQRAEILRKCDEIIKNFS